MTFDYSGGYLQRLMSVFADSDVAFVVLNPVDYTDHVMLNMTKENYEPCTRREELLRGLIGVYTDSGRRNPFCSVYLRREVGRGSIVCGKEGDNPLEFVVPRDFSKIG